jgi:hypothetical protein
VDFAREFNSVLSKGTRRPQGRAYSMHIVKDVMYVESAKQEEPRAGQQRSVITARGGPLMTHNSELFPAHPVEQRATDVKRPGIVERLQGRSRRRRRIPRSCSGTAPLYARARRNLPCRQARPSSRRNFEDIYAVVVRGALAVADYHDLAPDERR